MRVVLVRPWTDAHAGGGCCSGDPRHGVCLERPAGSAHEHDPGAERLGRVYRRLRAEVPEAEVEVTGAGNTLYLLPYAYGAARARGASRLAALGDAARATTAGAVLVDGRCVGHVTAMDAEEVVRVVRRLAGEPADHEQRRATGSGLPADG